MMVANRFVCALTVLSFCFCGQVFCDDILVTNNTELGNALNVAGDGDRIFAGAWYLRRWSF